MMHCYRELYPTTGNLIDLCCGTVSTGILADRLSISIPELHSAHRGIGRLHVPIVPPATGE
eukprot:2031886-Prorocentrum_lima.AAC.1